MRKPNQNRAEAFTLIELAVTVTILMLLAAILFPAFSRVRDTARRSSCQSNLKQIGLAFMLYAQDSDETLPCGNISEPSANLGTGWATQIMPFAKSYGILKCPSEPGQQKAPILPASYAYNNNLVRLSTNLNKFLLRPLVSFSDPTRTVLCTEVRWGRFDPTLQKDLNSPVTNGINLFGGGQGNNVTNLQLATGLFSNSPADSSNCNNRDPSGVPFPSAHLDSTSGGGANYLAADGHVKWFRAEAISAGVYPNQPNRAQIPGTAESADYNGVGKHAMTYSHY